MFFNQYNKEWSNSVNIYIYSYRAIYYFINSIRWFGESDIVVLSSNCVPIPSCQLGIEIILSKLQPTSVLVMCNIIVPSEMYSYQHKAFCVFLSPTCLLRHDIFLCQLACRFLTHNEATLTSSLFTSIIVVASYETYCHASFCLIMCILWRLL